MSEARKWVGRGLDNVPGRPFGWAWNMERQAIREHLLARGWEPTGEHAERFRDHLVESRVSAIQQRIHRYRPTLRERQLAARAAANLTTTGLVQDVFTPDELRAILDRFQGANDPLGQSILAKASRAL